MKNGKLKMENFNVVSPHKFSAFEKYFHFKNTFTCETYEIFSHLVSSLLSASLQCLHSSGHFHLTHFITNWIFSSPFQQHQVWSGARQVAQHQHSKPHPHLHFIQLFCFPFSFSFFGFSFWTIFLREIYKFQFN